MKKLTLTITPAAARIAAESINDNLYLKHSLYHRYTNVWDAIIDEDEEDKILSSIEETLFLSAGLANEEFNYTIEEC